MDVTAEAMGARIRARREELGIRQNRLAEDVGLDQPQLCKIEKGKRRVTVAELVRIAAKLDAEPADFYAADDEIGEPAGAA